MNVILFSHATNELFITTLSHNCISRTCMEVSILFVAMNTGLISEDTSLTALFGSLGNLFLGLRVNSGSTQLLYLVGPALIQHPSWPCLPIIHTRKLTVVCNGIRKRGKARHSFNAADSHELRCRPLSATVDSQHIKRDQIIDNHRSRRASFRMSEIRLTLDNS